MKYFTGITVKELINQLQKCSPEAEVFIYSEDKKVWGGDLQVKETIQFPRCRRVAPPELGEDEKIVIISGYEFV